MKDKISIERVAKLHPKFRATFTEFIDRCEDELQIVLRVTAGLRTEAEQTALYAQGRSAASIAKKEKKVTNAKAWDSYHNYGLAIDLVRLDGKSVDWGYPMVNLAGIAAEMGIGWGGNFKTFKDYPHFEINMYRVSDLRQMVKENHVDAQGYVKI